MPEGFAIEWERMLLRHHGSEGRKAYFSDEIYLSKRLFLASIIIKKGERKNIAGPVLLDCHIDKNEKVLPMIPPGKSVEEIIL